MYISCFFFVFFYQKQLFRLFSKNLPETTKIKYQKNVYGIIGFQFSCGIYLNIIYVSLCIELFIRLIIGNVGVKTINILKKEFEN